MNKTHIPYGAWWSTPFCRWQGSFAAKHAIELAGQVASDFLTRREVPAEALDGLVLGTTVHQKACFYGAPWLAGLIGAEGITGPTIAQACATSARMLATAAGEVELGLRSCVLAVACDRVSNGPHIYYPRPDGPGGQGEHEDPVMDNFGRDPYAGGSMISTAERVAAREDIGRAEQDELTALRFQQYEDALADDRAFQRRYMLPVEIRRGRRVVATVEADEGIRPSTAEGLARLRPVLPDGTVTFGTQTHPADANAGLLVCSAARAAELSRDPAIRVRIRSWAEARAEKGHMPLAVVPAALQALERAGRTLADCAAVKIHNPFAAGDVYFCRATGLAPEAVNNFGSPLIYGHPQAPMGMRAIIELIEELALRGGGVGLFSGCAAGDTAMALVVEVSG